MRMRGVDTELVKRAQHGDREAFGLLAADLATRFLAVSRRILRDIDLAEDATQQALVAIWRDLPQLRDPARFDAWSYRLLVRACYAEGRRARARGRRTCGSCRLTSRRSPGGSTRSSSGTSSRRPSDACRWTTGPCWSCITTPTSRSNGWPRSWTSRSARSTPDFITRCAPCGRHSMPTRARRQRRHPDDHRTRSPARASSCRGFARTRTRTPSACSCAPSTRWTRRHSAGPGGRRGGPTR